MARDLRRPDQQRGRSGYGWAALHGALLGATVSAPPAARWVSEAVAHADRYIVVADDEVAEQARRLLTRLGRDDGVA